jgi:hypothetical protein
MAFGACGGGEDGSRSSTLPSADAPQSVREAAGVEELRRRAARVRQERRRRSQGSKEDRGSNDKAQTPAGETAQVEVQKHQDSGGGAAQFRSNGGDNSIQDLGREAGSSEREEAAVALHGYLDARVTGHWDLACSYLSVHTVAALEQIAASYGSEKKLDDCPEILSALAAQGNKTVLEQAAEVDVGALRKQGDHGFLLYHGSEGVDYAIPVVREEGTWKIGSLDGAPLP